jgi:two-component system, chemotaxis family, protein-glutamate methylesterase/glutaminase
MVDSPRVRVLVIDDSVVVRKVLSDVLSATPGIALAGAASNGETGLAKLEQLKPDVVTLDIEMPGMDGLKVLAEIRKRHPKLPVIMFSTLTEHGATATLDALALGATDYATKPTNSENLANAKEQISRDLVAKITGLKLSSPPPAPAKPAVPVTPLPHKAVQRRIDLVAIGTSTGGPNALAEVIPQLPKEFPVPVLVVQHMPALFTRMLAERLNARSPLQVCEGQAGQKLNPGMVCVAPGDYHMVVARRGLDLTLELNQDAPENSCRPAVDVLFRSVARNYGPHALGIVLTGMGFDGAKGAKAIRDAGGEVLVQDEGSSVVWGMPGAVVAAGATDQIYPLARVPQEIVRRVSTRRWLTTSPPSASRH